METLASRLNESSGRSSRNGPNTMHPYDVLLNIHHMGSRISATVVSHVESQESPEPMYRSVLLETDSGQLARLAHSNLVDDPATFTPQIIPKVGERVDAVVANFVDGVLYLSARPEDLLETTVRRWQEYYDYIGSLTIGSTIKGRVERQRPFGLFVNIGGPFIGLIDIGHQRIAGGVPLPRDNDAWPQEGDEINCRIAYFRLHGQQIGLGWLPQSHG